jgi:hypothetical protein
MELYYDPGCPHCQTQLQEINNNPEDYTTIDISKIKVKGITAVPTWKFKFKIKDNQKVVSISRVFTAQELMTIKEIMELLRSTENSFGKSNVRRTNTGKSNVGRRNTRRTRFGLSEIGTLAKYGTELFDNFNLTDSWETTNRTSWGTNDFMSGTLGRELGPNADFGQVYNSRYFHQPRMAHPSGDLATALFDNRNYNTINNPDANKMNPGLFSDSRTPLSFGRKVKTIKKKPVKKKPVKKKPVKKKSKFGNYAKAYSSNVPLTDFGGGIQGPPKQPKHDKFFINTAFGKKKPKKRPTEGSVITIRKVNGKCKIKVD